MIGCGRRAGGPALPKALFRWGRSFIRAVGKKKLAVRIDIVTTAITPVGMTLLWLVVSANAAAMVKNDITDQGS